MDNDKLGAIIPSAQGRKIAYAVYGLISFVVGNAVVFYAATSMDVPVWLIGVVAVVNNCAPLFGAVAIANAPASAKQIAKAEESVAMHASVEVPFE